MIYFKAAFRKLRCLGVADPSTDHQPLIEAYRCSVVRQTLLCTRRSPSPLAKARELTQGLEAVMLAWEVLSLHRDTVSREHPQEVRPALCYYRDPESRPPPKGCAQGGVSGRMDGSSSWVYCSPTRGCSWPLKARWSPLCPRSPFRLKLGLQLAVAVTVGTTTK